MRMTAMRNPEGEASSQSDRRPVVLTIAGFDPSSGAGVTADLKVFAAFGLYGMTCVTALTVQSTQGVRAVEPVPATTIAATLQMLAEDVEIGGIKVGMLATAEICRVVGEFLESLPRMPVVVDPVFRSSSGRELLEAAGVSCLRDRLLASAGWITPNLEELSILTGEAVASREDVPPAAQRLRGQAEGLGNRDLHVLVTGGHLNRPDDYLLAPTGDGCWIPGELVETNATHGTGCALSSALLAGIVIGREPLAAATGAKEYVTTALREAYPVGHGKGPMNHLFAMDRLHRG